MGGIIGTLLGLAAVVALGWLTWISVQSLKQALLLKRLSGGDLSIDSGCPTALHGRVVVTDPLRRHAFGEVLWYHSKTQELRGYGKNRHWSTVGEAEEMAGFGIHTEGREIWIEETPTEVQGTRRETDHDDRPGCLGFASMGWGFGGERPSRTVTRWLPVVDRATIIGRVIQKGERLELVKDKKLGLLLSPHPPRKAMIWEAAKGSLGLLAVIILVAFALSILNP